MQRFLARLVSGRAMRRAALGGAAIWLGSAAAAHAEPTLEDTLCDMGFPLSGICGVFGYQEILCTRPDGINCFVVMPPGPYKVTLLAEHSGAHASLELSVFTGYGAPLVGDLLFAGPTGNEGETNPRLTKFVIMDTEFGFTLDAPDGRFYSVNFLNPDPVPFGPGFLFGHHVRTFQNGLDKTQFLIGFEQTFNGGDEDFQDLVFAVEAMAECPDGTSDDSDGDGLLDCWESAGEIDFDDDGSPDLSLRNSAGVNLADPDHKDLFIEMDWRAGAEPTRAAIDAIKQAFALAPKDAGGTVNPDDALGINVWIDTGGLMEDGALVGDDMGGGTAVPGPVTCLDESFYTTKNAEFAAVRRYVFRYAVSGTSANNENQCAGGTKKVGGKAEIGGNDFVFYNPDPAFAFHELGHTLNLGHGGFEGQNNKPNYVSMMNYNYGLKIPQVGGGGILDFSPPLCASCPGGRGMIPLPILFEDDLDESIVLDPNDNGNLFQFRDADAVTTNWPVNGDCDADGGADGVDWDGDGSAAQFCTPATLGGAGLTIDINEDGEIDDEGLEGYDDWSNIALSFREFGEDGEKPINPVEEPERTIEEIAAQEEELNTTDLEVAKSDLPDPVNAGAALVYTLTVTNHGPRVANGVRVIDTLPAEASYVSDTGGCVEDPPGILTCQPGPLLPGESDDFEITVVIEPAAVADLPAPVMVENFASVENKVPFGIDGSEVGDDPDPSNNDDSEQTTVNRPPVAIPGGPYVEECQGAVTSVQLDGSASFDPDGDPITFEWTTDCPGGVFDDPTSATPTLTVAGPPPCPVACNATLTVADPMNLSDTADASVTIEDTTPPTIEVVLAPTELWPANHKLVEITATVVAADVCDQSPSVVLTSITSDEPDDATGDGNTTGDVADAAVGTADLAFKLRAERAGPGDGRTYTVTYTATDDCGLSTSGSATVSVSHDQ